MDKITLIEEGVAAKFNGKYWGLQHGDARYAQYDFGPLDKAKISNPEFCKKPTDITWTPTDGWCNPDYVQLKKAKLVKVRRTIITEII